MSLCKTVSQQFVEFVNQTIIASLLPSAQRLSIGLKICEKVMLALNVVCLILKKLVMSKSAFISIDWQIMSWESPSYQIFHLFDWMQNAKGLYNSPPRALKRHSQWNRSKLRRRHVRCSKCCVRSYSCPWWWCHWDGHQRWSPCESTVSCRNWRMALQGCCRCHGSCSEDIGTKQRRKCH